MYLIKLNGIKHWQYITKLQPFLRRTQWNLLKKLGTCVYEIITIFIISNNLQDTSYFILTRGRDQKRNTLEAFRYSHPSRLL